MDEHFWKDQPQLLASLFDEMSDAVMVADHEGRFVMLNKAARAIVMNPGMTVADRTPHAGLFRADEATPLPVDESPVARALRGEEVLSEELYVRNELAPRGMHLNVNARPLRDGKGKVRGAVLVVRDVSAVHAERRMLESARQDFLRVIEAVPDGIVIHRQGRIIYANHAAAASVGVRDSSEITGRSILDFVDEGHRALVIERIQATHAGNVPPPAEIVLRRATGEPFVAEANPALLSEFEGGPAVLLVLRDMTERRRIQEQLLVADRMASVGTLAAGVAHELNNPLAAVLANLEHIQERMSVQASGCRSFGPTAHDDTGTACQLWQPLSELEEAANDAYEGAERMRDIVRDLKVFSRVDEERRGPVDVRQALDGAARLAWNEVRHRAQLVRRYDDVPPIYGNDARVGQVFLNLIVNAAHAIPEGQATNNEIRLGTRAEGDRVVVEVQDSGIGMTPDVQRRIFDPFFTTKPIGVGTGLGLAICHRIVSAMDGTIEVASAVGSGTIFRLSFPRAAVAAAAGGPAEGGRPAAALRGRILIVDDDVLVARALERTLRASHEISIAAGGRDALLRLRAGERYDLILTDVMMPEITAMDLHAQLGAFAPDQARRMVLMTGGAFTERARLFLEEHREASLSKPVNPAALLAMVQRVLAAAGPLEPSAT